jgi:hypothetical protein
MSMIVRTIVASAWSVSASLTKERSILSAPTGKRVIVDHDAHARADE